MRRDRRPLTQREAGICAAVCLALAAIAGVLMLQGCTPECARQLHGACWYGETLTPETEARIAAALPLLPADPWPCVWTVHVGHACPGTHGCYWPDQRRIESTQAAFVHEISHAAAECATGNPDYSHAAPWWREVDGLP